VRLTDAGCGLLQRPGMGKAWRPRRGIIGAGLLRHVFGAECSPVSADSSIFGLILQIGLIVIVVGWRVVGATPPPATPPHRTMTALRPAPRLAPRNRASARDPFRPPPPPPSPPPPPPTGIFFGQRAT